MHIHVANAPTADARLIDPERDSAIRGSDQIPGDAHVVGDRVDVAEGPPSVSANRVKHSLEARIPLVDVEGACDGEGRSALDPGNAVAHRQTLRIFE